MKLRYYLRGLGIGMLVTAMILILAPGEKKSLSDEEIRARAAQLGMIESSSLTLADMQSMQGSQAAESTPQSQETQEAQETKETQASQATSESAGQSQETQETQETQAASESASQPQEPQETQETQEAQASQAETMVGVQTSDPKVEDGVEIIEITIPGGASSGAVSRQLANAGLVENAREYDNYLCNNGYSRRIRVGIFKIPVGAEWQEIADIISSK